ncbi:MAG TPA: DUF3343 domain-containing protein [Syntrophomonadaceae bacterium]|jgi:hypothetical protein|nr:DUF3343 domain-containing protein [Syntrophomonadaceae bacterium]
MAWFGKSNKSSAAQRGKQQVESGLVIFYSVEDAIMAERILNKNDIRCRLVAPPPFLRKGCDLALEINLIQQAAVQRILQDRVPVVQISPLSGTAELLDIIKVSEYDGYTMVKAGNMKLTFENASGMIVNTSGGGCPDIPYMNIELVGKRLDQIRRPKEMGHSLCSLMLDRAAEGAQEIWEERKSQC